MSFRVICHVEMRTAQNSLRVTILISRRNQTRLFVFVPGSPLGKSHLKMCCLTKLSLCKLVFIVYCLKS